MPGPNAEQRFQSLYDAYQRPVLAYFLRRTDEATAFDGAAETFLVAWRRIDDVPDDRQLPWLYGVSRRVLANLRRGERRYRALGRRIPAPDADAEPGPEAIVVRSDEDRQVLDAVATLRPEDQEIIRLRVWEELSNTEIAEVIGTSPHAISQRVHRITRRLAHELSRPAVHRVRPVPSRRHGGDGR